MKALRMGLLAWLRGLSLSGLPPAPYNERSCQGSAWRRTFPEVPKQDVRDFLDVFVGAFAFRPSSRLNFAPDDSLLAIYKAVYPSTWAPDALEIETLGCAMARRFGIQVADVWHDALSSGELFAATRRARELR